MKKFLDEFDKHLRKNRAFRLYRARSFSAITSVAIFLTHDLPKIVVIKVWKSLATKFIPASQSPTGVALLAVGHEVSGSVAVYQIK
jgi:hypothetical protein